MALALVVPNATVPTPFRDNVMRVGVGVGAGLGEGRAVVALAGVVGVNATPRMDAGLDVAAALLRPDADVGVGCCPGVAHPARRRAATLQ